MAEPCPSPNSENILPSISTLSTDADVTKTDCTSPSPTETVCLESLCTDTSIPGPSHERLVPQIHNTLHDISRFSKDIPAEEKDLFLNKLGLDKVEECLDISNDDRFSNSHDCDEENWEDCVEGLEVDEEQPDILQITKDQVSWAFCINYSLCIKLLG